MRFNERSFAVLVGAGLAAAIAVVLILSLGSDDEPSDSAPSTGGNAASSLEGGPAEFLYLSGSRLVRRNVEDDTEEQVGDVPSPSVYAAPGSSWLAYVTSKTVSDDDFATEPVLALYDVETEEKYKYGAGVAPVWNPAGTHVAFVKPVEPRNCVGEECPGASQIGVVEAATGEETVLLEPARYTVLGWSGDLVLVSDFDSPAKVIAVSLDDRRTELDMPASQFWAASPDGRWVVKTNAKKTEFVAVDDGELGEERVTVPLGDRELLTGAWAHDSSGVAAITRETSQTIDKKKSKAIDLDPTTQVVTFSPEDPKPVAVEESNGATGTLYWAVDNAAVVFATLVDPSNALFQAKHCPLGNEGDCKIVTSWTEGVALLRAE